MMHRTVFVLLFLAAIARSETVPLLVRMSTSDNALQFTDETRSPFKGASSAAIDFIELGDSIAVSRLVWVNNPGGGRQIQATLNGYSEGLTRWGWVDDQIQFNVRPIQTTALNHFQYHFPEFSVLLERSDSQEYSLRLLNLPMAFTGHYVEGYLSHFVITEAGPEHDRATTILPGYLSQNGSGRINLLDFIRFRERLGKDVPPGQNWYSGDFNADEGVDLQDFSYLVDNFNMPAFVVQGSVVPEPAGLTLALLALAAYRFWRNEH